MRLTSVMKMDQNARHQFKNVAGHGQTGLVNFILEVFKRPLKLFSFQDWPH